MDKHRPPRLSVELTDQQALDLRNLLPHGMQKALFRVVVDDVIRMAKKHKEMFFAAILAKQISFEQITSLDIKEVKNESVQEKNKEA